MEKDGASRSDLDLGSIAGQLQLFVALKQGVIDGVALFDRTRKKRFRQSVQPKVKRIEQDQACLLQQASKEFAESASVGFLRLIALVQNRDKFALATQGFRGGLPQCADFGAERHTSDRSGVADACGQVEFDQLALVKKRGTANFVQIM